MSWGRKPRVRKYRAGAEIREIYEMIGALHSGRYIFVRGKPYHPAVLSNWSLASLESVCRLGAARAAELTPEWTAAEAERAKEASENPVAEFAEIGEPA